MIKNDTRVQRKHVLPMFVLACLLALPGWSYAQLCGFATGEGCANTNYDNAFLKTLTYNNPATIEYDNFVSAYHSTIVRTSSRGFKIWGEHADNDGYSNVLTPQDLNATNYPSLGTAKVLKVTSNAESTSVQFVALATNGLYTWGSPGRIVPLNSTPSNYAFHKITVNGKADGLPPGVSPLDVKMMTSGQRGTLLIVTCSGDVWVLSEVSALRANGSTGTDTQWYRAQTSAGNYLTGVIAARLVSYTVFALKNDGTLWTWGDTGGFGGGGGILLGDGTAAQNRSWATQMTAPAGTPKMIGITNGPLAGPNTYYVLMTNGSLFALGDNSQKQIGDWTTTERRTWVQPRYTSSSGLPMNNIAWISPNETASAGAINVLTTSGQLYSWGTNDASMIGQTSFVGSVNPNMPNGISPTDKIIAVETGGHTSMIVKECSNNFGYVGHRTNGSMGNGSAANIIEESYTFATAPVEICAAEPVNVTVPTAGPYCNGSNVQLTATPTGGTYTVTSGPATVNGTGLVTFTGGGSAVVQYTSPASCGATISKSITLVSNNITPGVIAADQTLAPGGDPAAFTVTTAATGSGTLSYQWQSSTDGTTWNDISGATGTVYDIPSGITATTQYRRADTSTLSGAACTLYSNIITVTVTGTGTSSSGLCGYVAGEGCANTDYNNSFLKSTTAATLEYDNMVSFSTGTMVRTSSGGFKVWGGNIANNGSSNVLSPQDLNKANYPALGATAKVLKVAADGSSIDATQFFALATDGLYSWGRGGVASAAFGPGYTFHKVTINGKADGLPTGVSPSDVKMMTASHGAGLVIVTCTGSVYILGDDPGIRANGSTGSALQWSQAQTSPGNYLTGVVAARIAGSGIFALKSDGTLWTWGFGCYLGNNTSMTNYNMWATQMTAPPGTPKMIGILIGPPGTNHTYYVLMTDGNLYALGYNSFNQIGDWIDSGTSIERRTWVQPRYTSTTGPVLDNIAWISPNESNTSGGMHVLTTSGQLYSWGGSIYGVGSTGTVTYGPVLPYGISATDKIIAIETGGNTTMVVKECNSNFGYVGHRGYGSFGDGTASNVNEPAYVFNTTSAQILCSAVPVDITAPGTASGSYCSASTVQLTASPAGGTYTVTSGPATVSSTGLVTFTGADTVVVQYTSPASCGSAISNTITLVSNSLTPGVIAADQTLAPGGDPAAFTVTTAATGSDAISYQWQSSIDNGGTWSNISGATSNTYDPPAGITTSTRYRRADTSGACTAYTNVVTVIVCNVTGTVPDIN